MKEELINRDTEKSAFYDYVCSFRTFDLHLHDYWKNYSYWHNGNDFSYVAQPLYSLYLHAQAQVVQKEIPTQQTAQPLELTGVQLNTNRAEYCILQTCCLAASWIYWCCILSPHTPHTGRSNLPPQKNDCINAAACQSVMKYLTMTCPKTQQRELFK